MSPTSAVWITIVIIFGRLTLFVVALAAHVWLRLSVTALERLLRASNPGPALPRQERDERRIPLDRWGDARGRHRRS